MLLQGDQKEVLWYTACLDIVPSADCVYRGLVQKLALRLGTRNRR